MAEHARDIGLARATDKDIVSYTIQKKRILITKDLEFGDPRVFSIKAFSGLVILRLPFYFTASQIAKTLKDFLNSTNLNELKNALTIVKLGRYRTRKI